MRVVLIGHGGREAALAWRIMKSPTLTSLLVTGSNPGWPEGVTKALADGIPAWVALAADARADLVVCGPEVPLAAGLADALAKIGIPCFGPQAAAAQLEASKAFAKEVMIAAGVPTPGALVADLSTEAGQAAAEARAKLGNVVVKADGLAGGKGVVVCTTAAEALGALQSLAKLGGAARQVLLEDLLTGPEVSLFAMCDGERVVALPSAQDHKQLRDGGLGPNTGGMGAIVPCPLVDAEAGRRLVDAIHRPVVAEMARRGTPFRGLLYAGLMMTPEGPQVLEFNVRFGDPECQPMMTLWDEDILVWLHGAATGQLPAGQPKMRSGHACCVVLASAGYPAGKSVGVPIPEPNETTPGVTVFHAGTRRVDGGLQTAGGRVLGVTAVHDSAEEARVCAYAAAAKWRFEGSQMRSDIGLGEA